MRAWEEDTVYEVIISLQENFIQTSDCSKKKKKKKETYSQEAALCSVLLIASPAMIVDDIQR